MAKSMEFASFKSIMPLFNYPTKDQRYECPADALALNTGQVQQVSGFLRTNVGATQVNNNADRECTEVASQHESAVYICNMNGIDRANACGAVDGNHVADAIDDILKDTNCVKKENGPDGLTGGWAWVTGPLVNPSFQCEPMDASYIQLVQCEGVTW